MVMDKIFFYRPELFRNENGDNNMKDLTLEEFFEEYEKAYIFKFDEQDNSIIIKRHNIFYSEPGLKRKSLAESTQIHMFFPDFSIRSIESTFVNQHFQYDIDYIFEDDKYHISSRINWKKQLYKSHKNLHPHLITLFADYFQSLCDNRNRNISLNKSFGWTNNSIYNNEELFQSDSSQKKYMYGFQEQYTGKQKYFPLIKLDKSALLPDGMEFFLNMLEDSDALTTIFSYSLLSVSLNAELHYTCQNNMVNQELNCAEDKEAELFKIIEPFSLCIYGENPDRNITRKAIASMFLDFTKTTYKYPNRVCNHLPHATLKQFIDKIAEICKFADCPIIISPSGNVENIVSTARQLKTLELFQKRNYIKGFPVLLSKSAVRRDKVLNIDISTIPAIPSPDEMISIEILISDYILFIERVLNKDYPGGAYKYIKHYGINDVYSDMTRKPFEKYSNIFCSDEFNEDLAKCCRDILTALHGFTIYIDIYYPALKTKIDNILENQISFLQDLARDCESRPQKTASKKTSKPSQNIKKDFFNVISKICQGQPNAIVYNETDVYIDYKVFQKYYARTDYKAFLNKCRSSSLVNAPVRPNTGEYRGFTYSRIINGKKTNVLVVPRKLYDKYVSNSPS